MAPALRLTPDEPTGVPVALDDAIARVRRGEILLLEGALQRLGWFERYWSTTLAVIADVVSPAAARAVAESGIERLHEIADGRAIFDVHEALTARLTPTAPDLVADLVRGMLGFHDPIFVSCVFFVRLFVPHDVYVANQKLFSTRPAHLEILGPHRDSWFTNPLNAITVWMAMGRVSHGNSMMIYPELWGRPVARETRPAPLPQPLGRPMTFALAPGDMLLVQGEHLHSSELNVTGDTRYVLTTRFTIGAPRYGVGSRWMPYANLRLARSWAAPLATARSRLTPAYARYRAARLRATGHRARNALARRLKAARGRAR